MAVAARFHGAPKPCRGTGHTSRETLKNVETAFLFISEAAADHFETVIAGAVFSGAAIKAIAAYGKT